MCADAVGTAEPSPWVSDVLVVGREVLTADPELISALSVAVREDERVLDFIFLLLCRMPGASGSFPLVDVAIFLLSGLGLPLPSDSPSACELSPDETELLSCA